MYYIGRVEHGIALRSFSFRRHLLVCLFVGSFFVFCFFVLFVLTKLKELDAVRCFMRL